ncbi:hypothetical protein D3C72_1151130 [compost metagenome]
MSNSLAGLYQAVELRSDLGRGALYIPNQAFTCDGVVVGVTGSANSRIAAVALLLCHLVELSFQCIMRVTTQITCTGIKNLLEQLGRVLFGRAIITTSRLLSCLSAPIGIR